VALEVRATPIKTPREGTVALTRRGNRVRLREKKVAGRCRYPTGPASRLLSATLLSGLIRVPGISCTRSVDLKFEISNLRSGASAQTIWNAYETPQGRRLGRGPQDPGREKDPRRAWSPRAAAPHGRSGGAVSSTRVGFALLQAVPFKGRSLTNGRSTSCSRRTRPGNPAASGIFNGPSSRYPEGADEAVAHPGAVGAGPSKGVPGGLLVSHDMGFAPATPALELA
jgi:hypothetical protein